MTTLLDSSDPNIIPFKRYKRQLRRQLFDNPGLKLLIEPAETFFDTEAAMLLPDEIHPVDLEHARLRTLAYAIEQFDLPPTLEVTSGEVPDHLLPIFRYELAKLSAARNEVQS